MQSYWCALCVHVADPDFQSFLKQLEEGPELLPSAAIQREQQDKDRAAAASNPGTAYGAVIVTPLMAYLKEKYGNSGSGAAAKKRRVESEAKKKSEDGKQKLDRQGSKKGQQAEEVCQNHAMPFHVADVDCSWQVLIQ